MKRGSFWRTGLRTLILTALIACIGIVPAFAMIPPPSPEPPAAETLSDMGSDTASMADKYKLAMIKVSGRAIEGFDKDKLDYTYYMSSGEQAELAGGYGPAVTAELLYPGAEIIKSVNANRVLLYVNNNLDPDGITYSVTFLKGVDRKGSGLIFRENRYLLEIMNGKFSVSELSTRTKASLDMIIGELKLISDPAEAEKSYLELQDTLAALSPILGVLKTDKDVLQSLSDLTDGSRHLVTLIPDKAKIADLTVGFLGKLGGVFTKIDTSSTPANMLKNSVQNLGIEGAHETGLLKAGAGDVVSAAGKAEVSFSQGEIAGHLGQAKINFYKISNAMTSLLGSNNPRKLEYQITLKSDKPKGISALDTTLEKGILDSIRNDGAEKLELQLGEAAVAFVPDLLNADEKSLKFSTVFTPSEVDGVPRGTSGVPGAVTADVSLTSDVGPKTSFETPVLLTLDLSNVNLAGYTEKNLNNLGLYLLDESTGNWTPVGGNFDPITKTIKVFRLHLSKYTVLKTDKSFSDVQNSWAKDDINELLGKGVVQETPLFSPKGDLTREDFTRWIAKAYGLESTGQALPFNDVNKDHPYYEELSAAYSQGLIKGKTATAFDPKGKITRQEMATLISNALVKYQKAKTDSSLVAKLDKYPDSNKVAGWAKDTVAMVNEMGIMQGDSRGFRPTDYITREEAASLLKRIYN